MPDEEQDSAEGEGGEQPELDDEGIEPMGLSPMWGSEDPSPDTMLGLDLTETKDEFRTEQGAADSTIERDDDSN